MPKLYQISIRWEQMPSPGQVKPIEKKFGEMGDWLRFMSWSWLLSTNSSPVEIREALRQLLPANDQFLVFEVTPDTVSGWALPWIWDWLHKKRF